MGAIQLWKQSITQCDNVKERTLAINEASLVQIEQLLSLANACDRSLQYLCQIQPKSWFRKTLFTIDRIYERITTQSSITLGIFSVSRSDLVNYWKQSSDLQNTIINLTTYRYQVARQVGQIMKGRNKDQELPAHYLPGPTAATRIIIPGLALTVTILTASRWALKTNWRAAYRLTLDMLTASSNLLQDWIISPIVEIWRTIRYRSSNLALVSATALKADVESLERMILSFAQKHYPGLPETKVREQIRSGDATLMLRRYEMELQAPLRNAILGDLISMLLIQVQKSKVDLEGAMMAMDKLLKANELNFELLALIPVLAILYLAGGAGQKLIKKVQYRSERQLLLIIAERFHELEALWNGTNLDDFEYCRGETLIVIDQVMKQWKGMSSNLQKTYGEQLMKDFILLLDERSSKAKLWDLIRMHNYYPFLNSLWSQVAS